MKASPRSVLANAALLLTGVLMFFALGEIAFRVVPRAGDRFRRDAAPPGGSAPGGELSLPALVRASRFPDVVYELRPGIRGTFLGRPLSINAAGLRGRETSERKPAGTVRVAGLGDSIMFGWGVSQEETYLAVLERLLNESAGGRTRFETLNFAVPGYNAAIEAAVFERKALAFAPDLVVIQFVNNDFGVPRFMQSSAEKPFARRSRFIDFIVRRMRAAAGRPAGVGWEEDGLRDTEGEDPKKVLDAYRSMVGEEGYLGAMRRLASLTRPRGIPVIVIMGSSSGEQAGVVARAAAEHRFHLIRAAPYTDAYVREHGIPDTKEERRRALWVSKTDPHPNAEGHAIYARALLDGMRELGLAGSSVPRNDRRPAVAREHVRE